MFIKHSPFLQKMASILFYSLTIMLFLLGVFLSLEAWNILTADQDALSHYPFGTENGYRYISKEVYANTTGMLSFILIQGSISSSLIYFFQRKLCGLVMLLFMVIGSIFFSF